MWICIYSAEGGSARAWCPQCAYIIFNTEAVRVVKSLKRCTLGCKDGQLVRVQYAVNVTFNL